MDRCRIGMLAESKSGHDKGQIYVIIKEDAEYVYLSDGRLRPLDKLKKKNKKHIQVILKPVSSILKSDELTAENIEQGRNINNEAVKRAIKLFRKEIAE